MRIRIPRGRIKNRFLNFPNTGKDDGLRPTASKVRDALFNILRDKIEGSVFLDFFAGTGAVGFTAWSLGAEKIVFCDKNPLFIKAVHENAAMYGVCYEAYTGHYKKSVSLLNRYKKKFDIVFIDPPYFENILFKVLEVCVSYSLLHEGALLVCEHHKSLWEQNRVPFDFDVYLQKNYGETSLTFLRYLERS